MKPEERYYGAQSKIAIVTGLILDDAGVKRLPLPHRSPNVHAIVERGIRSVKEESLSKLILFGERSLWHVLQEDVAHHHTERSHQGKGNVMLFPTASRTGSATSP